MNTNRPVVMGDLLTTIAIIACSIVLVTNQSAIPDWIFAALIVVNLIFMLMRKDVRQALDAASNRDDATRRRTTD